MQSGIMCLEGKSWSSWKTRRHCSPPQHDERTEFKLIASASMVSLSIVLSRDSAICHCSPFEHVESAAL